MMDFVRSHHNFSIEYLITSRGNQLIFSPPYSSFLNPIVNHLNQLKFHVKRMNPSTLDAVFEDIELALQVITEDDCKNYHAKKLKYSHSESEFPIDLKTHLTICEPIFR